MNDMNYGCQTREQAETWSAIAKMLAFAGVYLWCEIAFT